MVTMKAAHAHEDDTTHMSTTMIVYTRESSKQLCQCMYLHGWLLLLIVDDLGRSSDGLSCGLDGLGLDETESAVLGGMKAGLMERHLLGSDDNARRLHDFLFLALLLFNVVGGIAGVGAWLELDSDRQNAVVLGRLLIDHRLQHHSQVQVALITHTRTQRAHP